MKGKLRVMFLGSPAYALPTLNALAEMEFVEVALVVTQPDRPSGRGQRLTMPPVKERALELGIPVIQPLTLKDDAVKAEFAGYGDFDLGVTVAYGLILPAWLLELPAMGHINAHASLLPQLRGAAPIQYAIMQGAESSGVTIQQMAKAMDAGDILWQAQEPIKNTDTAVNLAERLSKLSAEGVVETTMSLRRGTVTPVPQDHAKATFAQKISQTDGCIDWEKPSKDVFNLVRALLPWPCAWTNREGKRLKIQAASFMELPPKDVPGTISAVGYEGIEVSCGEGRLRVTYVQPENRSPMTARQFVNGYRVAPGEKWGE